MKRKREKQKALGSFARHLCAILALACMVCLGAGFAGCSSGGANGGLESGSNSGLNSGLNSGADGSPVGEETQQPEPTAARPTGLVAQQVLQHETGAIHYSYYLPEDYDENRQYPMMVVMPGYDMMWFGEDSAGANLNWRGFVCWTELDEDMIVVSAQLTDWHETSAQQAVALTEYFLQNFSVDPKRVYAAGYSAGGETMSQAVAMRPDLYAAYLHGASQWDGAFDPVAQNRVAVYIFMAEGDEYYGSQRARDAYDKLHAAYEALGWTQEEIDDVLQLQIPNNAYFNQRGITGNYHGGANILFEDASILNWIVSHGK